MRPVIFELFGLPIHGYGLMIVLGYLLTGYMATRIVRKWGMEDVFYDLSMVMLLSGILGGRTMFYILNYSAEFQHRSPFAFFKIWEGGLVLYGGVTGGCLGGLIYMSWKKLSVLDYMDVSGIVAPIGLAFGRLGCFMNGCCYGRVCSESYAIGVHFPEDSPPWSHQFNMGLLQRGEVMEAVHPAQLYQAGHDFLLFFLLLYYVGRGYAPRGAGMPLLWFLYGTGRFFIEGLRNDTPLTLTGLTVSQNYSLAVVLLFGVLLAWIYSRPSDNRAAAVPVISDIREKKEKT